MPFVYAGVSAPSVTPVDAGGYGVDAPLLFWVASTEASFLLVSERICLRFLFRRREGFQVWVRKGLGIGVMSI